MKRKEPQANLPSHRSREPSAFSTAVNSRAQSPHSTSRIHGPANEALSLLNKEALIEVIEFQQATIHKLEQDLAEFKLREDSILAAIVQETHESELTPMNLENFEACRNLILYPAANTGSLDSEDSESLGSSFKSQNSIKVGILALPDFEEIEAEVPPLKKIKRMERIIAKHENFILQLKGTLEALLEERQQSRLQHIESLKEITELKSRLSSTLDLRACKY